MADKALAWIMILIAFIVNIIVYKLTRIIN